MARSSKRVQWQKTERSGKHKQKGHRLTLGRKSQGESEGKNLKLRCMEKQQGKQGKRRGRSKTDKLLGGRGYKKKKGGSQLKFSVKILENATVGGGLHASKHG